MGLEDIRASLGLDSAKFDAGLKGAGAKVTAFTRSASAQILSLAGAAGLGSLANSAIQLGSTISDLAVQLNIGTEEIQALNFAAQDAGVATSLMERALRNVQLRTQQGIEGNKRYAEAFAQLNLDITTFNALPTERKLEAIAKAASQAEDKNAAYNAVAAILGERAGPALTEVLQRLATEGFDEVARAARNAGQVMDDETVASMDRAADEIERAKTATTILSGEILAFFIPIIKALGDGLGFIGDSIGTVIVGWQNFSAYLNTVITAVIQPGITAFDALRIAVQAGRAALDGNLSESVRLAMQSKETFASIADDVKAIPGQLAEASAQLVDDQRGLIADLGDDLETRAADIRQSWGELAGAIDETAESTRTKTKITDDDTAATEDNTEAVDEQTEATKENTAAQEANNAAVQEAIDKAEALATARRQAANAEANSGYNPDLDADYSAEFQRLMQQRGMTAENAQRLAIGNVNARQRRGSSSGTGLGGLAGLDATTLSQLGQAFSMLSYQPTGVERAILAAGGTIETPASRQAASDEAAARELAKLIDELERLNNNFERT